MVRSTCQARGLFSNSLGTDLRIWDAQVEAFGTNYHVLRYDTRGHGRSSTPSGDYTLEMLARDAVSLMDHLEISSAAYCGISLGALTGLYLGLHAVERFTALIAANTAVRIGSAEGW